VPAALGGSLPFCVAQNVARQVPEPPRAPIVQLRATASNVLKLFVLPFGKNVVDIVHIQRSVIPSAALDVQVFVELPTVGR
jgi:hypothetical protein